MVKHMSAVDKLAFFINFLIVILKDKIMIIQFQPLLSSCSCLCQLCVQALIIWKSIFFFNILEALLKGLQTKWNKHVSPESFSCRTHYHTECRSTSCCTCFYSNVGLSSTASFPPRHNVGKKGFLSSDELDIFC